MQTQAVVANAAPSVLPEASSLYGDAMPDPSKVRQAIALLVAAGNFDAAAEMADLGLVLYPKSEDVLSISALVAEVKQNWHEAHQILMKLQEVQGQDLQPSTLEHRIRVLRCMGAIEEAKALCDLALKQFPTNSAMSEELEALEALTS